MPRHVAIIFVHGMLTHDINFPEAMRERLLKRLAPDIHDFLHFRTAFWAGSVRDNQQDYLERATATGGLRHKTLRRYVVEGLGAAAAYQKTRNPDNSIYYQVQAEIAEKIKSFDMPDRDSCPLIFIGHSLGCHIISSFLWDMNSLKQRTAESIQTESDPQIRSLWGELKSAGPFRRLETCAGIVTMGSNIPMFTFSRGPQSFTPITDGPADANGLRLSPAFPGAALPSELKERARWLNFYSERDLLGYPLKSLNDEYRNAEKIHDICVQSEAPWFIPYVWCVYAHTRYWKNPVVLRDTSLLIREMVETPIGEAEATLES